VTETPNRAADAKETPGRAPSRRFTLGTRSAVVMALALIAIDAWAVSATDPDFFLPDVFRPISLSVVAVFLASALVRNARVRRALRTLVLTIVVALLLFEVRARYSDIAPGSVVRTEDRLLRYHYRPGADVSGGADHQRMIINHLGLWDREYAIPAPDDVYRIVVLTGSIANDGAIAFPDRFHEVLESRLADFRPDGRRVEVINASCDGWNTTQQVRFLERVAMAYDPDLVIVAYMLTSASLQDGSYRRIGNSFFTFRFLPLVGVAQSGSMCSVFAPLHESYSFELIVRNAFERLALLREQHGFRTLVAVLPVLEEFDDPVCLSLYDHVVRAAAESGHDTLRVVDAFEGEDFWDYVKPGRRMDLAHPNERGHARIASALETWVRASIPAGDQNSE
jgi:hypothetical protein